jgi:hypothetical protein
MGERIMRRLTTTSIAAAFLAISAFPAMAQSRAKVGTLDCDISGGIGLIITSKKAVRCTYTPASPRAHSEVYNGSIQKFGLDIGATTGGRMIWAVYSATEGYRHGALAGGYGGASAEATLVAGLGANVLIGGSDRSFALQPLSVQGQTGLNLAIGVTGLVLHSGS